MKRLFLLVFLASLCFACNENSSDTYVVEGEAKGFDDGVKIFLKNISDAGKDTAQDTAVVINEKFSFTGKTDYPDIHLLQINNPPAVLPFILENGKISVELYRDSLMTSKFVGSSIQKDMDWFNDKMQGYYTTNRDIVIEMRSLDFRKDSLKRDSLGKLVAANSDKMQALPLKFAKENPDAYFTLNLIDLEMTKPKFDVVTFKEIFESMPEELKESPKGVLVKEKLDEFFNEYQKTAYLEIGKKAPNFEAPTPNGDIISLDKIKGKVTIVDFWAAWCGPCRKENPNVVKIYNEYHDKGLEIIGVSLDGTPRQKDPKKAWTDAIEKDNLTWNHVSNLNYFNDPVAQLYNITAIPATYILDENGTIVAKNLRGRALERKIKELIEK